MKVKYIGPHDEVELAENGAVVKHGAELDLLPDESVEVDEAALARLGLLAIGLLRQPQNFEPVDEDAVALLAAIAAEDAATSGPAGEAVVPKGDGLHDLTNDQLKALAEAEGVDLAGATKKADLIEAIRNHRDNDDEDGA